MRSALILWSVLFSCMISAQDMSEVGAVPSDEALPQIFEIGSYEQYYKHLFEEYSMPFAGVWNSDMDLAYAQWLRFSYEIESFANAHDIDILGVKVWFNVFWNQDGTIAHIAYSLKPDSRNINKRIFSELLQEFVAQYRLDVDLASSFSHYASVTFPVFPESHR